MGGARIPGATYRLQFNRGFSFRDAGRLVPYLDDLGVTDCYASPYLKAGPNSTHGYDIVDHNALNPAIGSDEEYDQFVGALSARGMGQLLDVVPNHMGIGAGANAWWNDVLENGPVSVYASFFDIDWHPSPELSARVLLPILGDQYGRVLENGDLRLELREGVFFLRYWERRLPIAPRSYADILAGPSRLLADSGAGFLRFSPHAVDDEHLIELESIITAIGHLPEREATELDPALVVERNREKEVVKRRLAALTRAAPAARKAIDAEVRRLNGRPGDPASFDDLDRLLQRQAYRLSYWRVAAEEINYRRFFDVNELAALRMENPAVFVETHRLILRLVAEGKVTGLRIDHPDGLWDPAQYLRRLQIAASEPETWGREGLPVAESPAGGERADRDPDRHGLGGQHEILRSAQDDRAGSAQDDGAGRAEDDSVEAFRSDARPLYVVVEKILVGDESLPEDWPVHGTTGYDFLNAVGGIFVDGANRKRFDDLYARFIGQRMDLQELVYQSKRLIMRVSLASEVNVLAAQLKRLAERDRRSRDFTLNVLRDAMREVIACLPVYRTYITGRPVSERDRAYVESAVGRARRRGLDLPASAFEFLRATLLLEANGERRATSDGEQVADADRHAARAARHPDDEQLRFVMKFQQATGPVMAKAVEDTAFYSYHRLVALNEVGGEPRQFGVSVPELHRLNAERLRRWPHTLVSTSTHDSKRSEDVRARIAVLSELPRDWGAAVNRWARLNRRKKRRVDGQLAPSRNDEYLLYQTLIGVWPFMELGGEEPAAGTEGLTSPSAELVDRVREYMAKAIREAKAMTSWINPNEAYETAVHDFVGAILDAGESGPFLRDFRVLQRRVAHFGAFNSLAQVLLKLTVPGVPDIYQGNELWDFSLVDPDNRRRVDYAHRAMRLKALRRDVARATSGRGGGGRGDACASGVAPPLTEGGPPPPLPALARSLVDAKEDGRIKLYVTWRGLTFRRERGDLFRAGSYIRLEADGRFGEHVCAFARELDGDRVVVVVPRLLARVAPDPAAPPLGADVWGDTRLILSGDAAGGRYRNLFTDEILEPIVQDGENGRRAKASLPLGRVLAHFPVALLHPVAP